MTQDVKVENTQFNFKFAKNWRSFIKWYNNSTQILNNDDQKKMIEMLFEASVPNIVNWKQLWSDFKEWKEDLSLTKFPIVWQEQQNQIDTLLLQQLKQLDNQTFVIAYLELGTPYVDPEKFTYWEALAIKKDWDGNSNGEGGNPDVDKVTIINLNKIIK